ncbi:MAG: GtrA family protein [Oscillospiraceae bacterium]|jgi:putative flippase GtrA|nr:GtrA family protein [Oscillospiraceae bacterium]
MKIQKVVDRSLVVYLIVGVLNFIVCTALMFLLYNLANVSDHVAPVVNYGLGSLIWFISCKYWIFPGHKTSMQMLLRFTVEVLLCYLLTYYLAAPFLTQLALKSEGVRRFFDFGGADGIEANCKMSIGALLYALINYFGQRYYVFSDRFDKSKGSA